MNDKETRRPKDLRERFKGSRFGVRDGRLLRNGRSQNVPESVVRICLERAGYDPKRNHGRIRIDVGRRMLWIACVVKAVLAQDRNAASREPRTIS